jgi:hypothetical protein
MFVYQQYQADVACKKFRQASLTPVANGPPAVSEYAREVVPSAQRSLAEVELSSPTSASSEYCDGLSLISK